MTIRVTVRIIRIQSTGSMGEILLYHEYGFYQGIQLHATADHYIVGRHTIQIDKEVNSNSLTQVSSKS